MDTQPLVVIGVAAVLLAGGVGVVLADTGTTQAAGNATVTVSTAASVERAPDQATVTVAAVGRGETAAAARTNLTGDASAAEQALEDAGANVTTAQFSVSPEYESRDSGREQVGYVAVQTITAETSNVSSAGSLIDEAVDNGADRIEGVTFDLSDRTRTTAREEALTAAIERARDDATTLAAAENRTVGDAISVQTRDSGRLTVQREAATEADSQTNLSPGPIAVDTEVTVTYELN